MLVVHIMYALHCCAVGNGLPEVSLFCMCSAICRADVHGYTYPLQSMNHDDQSVDHAICSTGVLTRGTGEIGLHATLLQASVCLHACIWECCFQICADVPDEAVLHVLNLV